ncbi:MAG TPA: glycoside hydrolase domain-containing protein, partial [Longimicrobiales bacterium]|nr:glycoside hydrolase domain-containing protein [Longimicrobiales bacterium]
LLLLAATACGGATGVELPQPTPDEPPEESYRAVPGFDTRDYPGEGIMAAWRESSPYQWVGYYLPAPCYTGTTWQGKRESLQRQGWGIAVLFVGEQDWPTPAARDSLADDPRCVSDNLTPDNGAAHAREAQREAAREGFPRGTVIYLDVERVESVSDALAGYVSAWTAALLEQGRYVPGLYAHARNASELVDLMADEYASQGRTDRPRLWVASPSGFSLRRGPAESGFEAHIWQGALDVEERWGGHTLRIDANVAASQEPSGQ